LSFIDARKQEPRTKNQDAMALLLETTIGDLVIDLDVDGSPALCKNVLKLAKARYYTGNLVYNVQPNRFCQLGDPCGDGSGGACVYGVLDAYEQSRKRNNDEKNKNPNVLTSQRRFLKSDMGRALTEDECRQRGRVVATEMNGIADTIGSQLLITIDEGPDRGLDSFRNNGNISMNNNNNDGVKSVDTNEGLTPQKFRSVGTVVEDDNGVLEKLNAVYCDSNGRPYADVRIIRAMVIDDPFDDPEGMDQLLKDRGVTLATVGDDGSAGGKIGDDAAGDSTSLRRRVLDSPDYERPPEEKVETRISADDINDENATDGDLKKMRLQEEERLKRDDKSRAVVLEMLGDLPSANITAPENVLFVCKLNPVTEDDDLELIFSRFDEKVSADIVRDQKTGASLQYAFVEFTSKDQAAEAYFKMNNALVDDRRIKVDFSQSVSKVWDRFNQRNRKQSSSNHLMPKDPFREQQQQQQISHRKNPRGDRERNNDTSSDRRGNNDKMSNYSPHHTNHRLHDDTKNQRRDFSRTDHERHRGANHNKNISGRNTDRAMSDSHHDYHHSHPSVGYQTHRDRYARDRHEKRHNEGRDRNSSHFRSRNNGDDGDKDPRSRDHRTDRKRDESLSTPTSERKQGHDSGKEDYSVSDTSARSRSKRRRRNDEDRRRRSRSSSSGSCMERRERHRSGHKKVKKKSDRKRDDDIHHHKRSKRDNKHRHHRKDHDEARGRERHRDSPKSSRS
jgi:peptidyl-prolyl cis-trans isomerase-like 4